MNVGVHKAGEDVSALRVQHTVVGLAANDDAHAHAGAHGDVDAVFHIPGAAPGSFSQGGGVHIGVKAHGNTQCFFKLRHNGVVLPGQLRGGGDIAVGPASFFQVHRAEAADAQGTDSLAPEEIDHGPHGFRRGAGGDADPLQDIAVFVADGTDHFGSAGLQRAVEFHVFQLLTVSFRYFRMFLS